MVKSDSYSVSVTFGKAVYEAHQRTCTHTFETLEQLKTSQASTDTINFYKNMVRPNKKYLSLGLPDPTERGTCIKGLFRPHLKPKTENCFSPISYDWFI